MSDFKVGDRVADADITCNASESYVSFGKIVAISPDGNSIFVKWDDKYRSSPSAMSPADLLSEEDGKAKLTSLENQFKAVSAQVAEKLKIAANSLLEAQKIAAAAHYDVRDFYGITGGVLSAIGKCGWSSSSLSC